jgi:RpiB/LacA/LacB family sugar-phosphate isomerase
MDAVRIYMGSDHAGFSLRNKLVERLRGQGREIIDVGPKTDGACDYPEFASAVASAVRGDSGALGILVCATGQGMAIAAGKVRGIRAVNPTTIEGARLSRVDNDANILCLAGRTLSEAEANAIVDTWLGTSFAGGRHARRIAKIAAMETASAVAFATESERLGLANLGVPARIFDRDATLFSADPAAHDSIKSALAWLALPAEMVARLPDISAFVEDVRRARMRDLLLLVEDANASAASCMARMGGSGGLRLHVEGDHAQAAASSPEDGLDLESTLVLIVARGKDRALLRTREHQLWTLFVKRFDGDRARAGLHFAAIATPGSEVAQLAETHCYRKLFLDPPDLAESFAALACEGLLPAALFGLDPAKLLARARVMVDTCRREKLEDNPATSLGVLLGTLAKLGRYKLTLLLSDSLLPLGPWIARLLANTTRTSGRGIATAMVEPPLASYPPDRIFVHLQSEADPPAIPSEQMEALHLAGQPCIQIAVRDKYDVAAEIYRWQMAATVAALVLGSHGRVPSDAGSFEQDLPVP